MLMLCLPLMAFPAFVLAITIIGHVCKIKAIKEAFRW